MTSPSVAPYMGAWIEIAVKSYKDAIIESLPTWERGLKLAHLIYYQLLRWSLPTWERGLKF